MDDLFTMLAWVFAAGVVANVVQHIVTQPARLPARPARVSTPDDGLEPWQQQGDGDGERAPEPKPEQYQGAAYIYDRYFGVYVRKENDCPICRARNQQRKKEGKEPLPGYVYARRASDSTLWCRRCDVALYEDFRGFVGTLPVVADPPDQRAA